MGQQEELEGAEEQEEAVTLLAAGCHKGAAMPPAPGPPLPLNEEWFEAEALRLACAAACAATRAAAAPAEVPEAAGK